MFLEVHVTLVDDLKRFLDLKKLCAHLPGTKIFGTWKDCGDYIECSAIWMALFGAQFNNFFADLDMYWSRGDDVGEFARQKVQSPDLLTGFLMAMMTL